MRIWKRTVAMIVTLAMVLAWMPFMGAKADGIAAGSQLADPSTMDSWKTYFGRNDTAYAGAIWTDKSVFTDGSDFSNVTHLADGSSAAITVGKDHFLVALSAIASTSQIVGYSTTPTDTMLVLDVSGSMASTYTAGYTRQRQGNRYNYTEITAADPETVEAMITAANDAIHQLLTLNEHNRVGVVLYSGNTVSGNSGSQTGTLLLPLGRYAPVVSGGKNTYLSADLTEKTDALYRKVNNNYQSLGNVTYCSQISVSLANGLKTEEGGNVADTGKQVVGGTYIQNGLNIAWKQFEDRIAANDTVIPEGKVQAGVNRMPIMVLMSDGSPTTATTAYQNIGTSLAGNGTSDHATSGIGFLTQLTASWIREKMEEGYNTAPRFYTLGLADAGTQATAVGVLNPSSATNNAAQHWTAFLKDGSLELTLPRTNHQTETQKLTVTRQDDTTLVKNYVDQYWYASDAQAMINAFTQIVDEIILQSKYYATLVNSGQHNVDGYVTITDELGAFMEVKKVTGIVLGNTLYSGTEMAKALTSSLLGTPQNPSDLGNEFIWTVMERMGIDNASDAQNLIDDAYTAKQLWQGDAVFPASNYIGWYESADGKFLGHWADTHTPEDYPNGAAYINKSYGYLGKHSSNLTSDMMHIVVKISENIANGNQAVTYQIPASLIPMVTYTVGLDTDSLATAQNITLTSNAGSKSPMRLLFEVGLKEEINPVTVDQIVGTSDHYHKNDDGSYSFYSNRWGITDLNDPGNPTSHLVATAHFNPSMENEYYRFKEAEVVRDAGGNPVGSLDLSGGTQYYYQRQVISAVSGTSAKVTNVLMPLSSQDLSLAKADDGRYVLPMGAPNMPANDVRLEKSNNTTDTLDYYVFPYGVYNQDRNDYNVYTYLGNNGTFRMYPATGLKLTKTVTEVIAGAEDTFRFTITLSEAAPDASVTDTLGNMLTDGWSVQDNVITVNLKAGETVCIIGLPAGATYTVTEEGNDYISTVTPATGTVESQKLLEVSAVNSPLQYGSLLISKEVVHPYEADPAVLAQKAFAFTVTLTGSRIEEGQTYHSTMGQLVVQADGTLLLQETLQPIVLHNDGSVIIYNLPQGTGYEVKETDIPDGFALEHVNGETDLTAAQGNISPNATAQAAFVNRYPAENFVPVSLDITVQAEKILTDPENRYSEGEDFLFVLKDESGNPVGEVISVKAGNVAEGIRTLTFREIGKYTFALVEVAGNTPGMTYSSMQAMFTVTVTDQDMDGKLEISGMEEVAHITLSGTLEENNVTASAQFTNVYAPEATSVTLPVHKTLRNNSGSAYSLTNFQFALFGADELGVVEGDALQTVTANASGDAAFTLAVDRKGTFTYVIREVIPQEAQEVNGKWVLNGMTYDATAYVLTVVTDVDETGKVYIVEKTLIPTGGEDSVEVAEFTNTYSPAGAKTEISFGKEMDGRNLNTHDNFTFRVERTDATFTQLHDDTSMNIVYDLPVESNDSSSVHSAALGLGKFTRVGTYYFRLYEEKGGSTENGVTYDPSVYHITVTVTDNGSGELTAAAVVHKLGDPDPLQEEESPRFTNVYQVTEPAELILKGNKTLTGRKLEAGEFSFTLKNQEGAVLQTVTNHADGSYRFDALTFTPADIGNTFTYTVQEVTGDLGGITYSQKVYTVTVTVSDNGKGGVALTTVAQDDNGTVAADKLNFVNTYTTRGTGVTLSGVKTLTGRDLKDGEFSFQLLDSRGNVLQTATNENGKFSFGLSYGYTDENNNDLGEYNYVIREVIPELGSEDRLGGVWYDAATYEIKVSVTDLNGKMSAAVTVVKTGVGEVSRSQITFGNTYSVEDEKSITFSGVKTLVGRELGEKEFGFLLLDEEGNTLQSVYNNADGSFAFQKLTYTQEDLGKTYTYTVKEWIPAQEDDRLSGVIYSDKVYTVKVTLSDNGDGKMKLTYTVDGKQEQGLNSQLNFTNLYGSEAVYVTLGGTKQMAGDRTELLPTDIYAFQLVDAATQEVIETVTNDGTGKFSFEKLMFTYTDQDHNDLGEHYYIIREVEGSLGGVTYSTTHYDVKIVVSDGGGQLTALVVVQKDDAQTVSKNDIVFVNTYTVSDTEELTLSGKKTLTGRNLNAEEFNFLLVDETGKTLQTVTNDENGGFSFETLTYTVADAGKTYTYTVLEEIPTEKAAGITYSDKVYTVAVTVTDNGDGTLSLTYTVDGKQEENANGRLDFVNTYTVGATSVKLSGTKQMAGDRTQLLKSDVYTFQLFDAATGEVLDTKQNDGSGNFFFDAITYTYTDENDNDLGTYEYVIRELTGNHGGVSFDTTEYFVTVTVTDVGGQLAAAVAIRTAKGAANKVIYTNIYAVSSTTLVLEGTKELVNKKLESGQFQFAVLENGEEVATGANDGRGNILFDEITYTGKGVHTYTVVEKIPTDAEFVDGQYVKGGYTYDSAQYTVTVTVVDNNDGTLTATASYAEPVFFRNVYTPTDLQVPVILKKTTETNGDTPFSPEGFTFNLMSGEELLAQTTSDQNGDGIFRLSLGMDAVDLPVTLTVSEVDDNQRGVIYDKTVYTLEITTRLDSEKGELYAEYTVNGEAAENLVLSFHNVYEESDIPNTGDEDLPILWLSLMALTAAGILVLLLTTKKKEEEIA